MHVSLCLFVPCSASGLAVRVNATNMDAHWPLPFYSSWHSYFMVDDVSKATITTDPCMAW